MSPRIKNPRRTKLEPEEQRAYEERKRAERATTGTKLLAAHIPEIERLAWENTPDWDNWCGHACERVSEYLHQQGIDHTIKDESDVPFHWGTHTWIELADGTIVDPTVTQFWGEGHPRTQGSPSTARTAILPPDHPAAAYYT